MKNKLIIGLALFCMIGMSTQSFGLLRGVGQAVEKTTEAATGAVEGVTRAVVPAAERAVALPMDATRRTVDTVTAPLTNGQRRFIPGAVYHPDMQEPVNEPTISGMDEDENPADNLPKDVLEMNQP